MLEVYLKHYLAATSRANTWTLGVSHGGFPFIAACIQLADGPIHDCLIDVCSPVRPMAGKFILSRRSSDVWQIGHGRHATESKDASGNRIYTEPLFIYLTHAPCETSQRLALI